MDAIVIVGTEILWMGDDHHDPDSQCINISCPFYCCPPPHLTFFFLEIQLKSLCIRNLAVPKLRVFDSRVRPTSWPRLQTDMADYMCVA